MMRLIMCTLLGFVGMPLLIIQPNIIVALSCSVALNVFLGVLLALTLLRHH